MLERRFDINHVYTGLGDWHFLSVLGRRPIVMTITQRGGPSDPSLLKKVAHVVAESDSLGDEAHAAGVARERISVMYPGVDLEDFPLVPPPPAAGSWKCVFASSPENTSEVHTKGLDLLVELARQEPSFELTVLWRPFGPASDEALRTVRANCPPNVHFEVGRAERIQAFYERAHFSVAPFRTVGKPCPNSVIEALAMGRPGLVSNYTDLGGVLEREQAGVRFSPTIEDLRRAYHDLCRRYVTLQAASRACAERHFNLDAVIQHYARVYAEVTAGTSVV
jgi:glycosyltransferase involved in cell wall biosynthesis